MLTLAELQQYGEVYQFAHDFLSDFTPDLICKIRLLYWQEGRLNRFNYIIRAEQMMDGGLEAAWGAMLAFVNTDQPKLQPADLSSHDGVLEWAKSHKFGRDNVGVNIVIDNGWRSVLAEDGHVLERTEVAE